jgi:hypothetical protein
VAAFVVVNSSVEAHFLLALRPQEKKWTRRKMSIWGVGGGGGLEEVERRRKMESEDERESGRGGRGIGAREKRVGCENDFWPVPDVDGRSELSN